MAIYRNINVRSPWFAQYATTEATASLALRIWTGDAVTNRPADATYTLSKQPSSGSSTFEIAELVRDHLSQTSSLSSGCAWAEVILSDGVLASVTETYLASEGYQLYTEDLAHSGNSYETDFVALPSLVGTANFRTLVTESEAAVIPVYVQPQNGTDWRYQKYIAGVGQGWVAFPVETTSNNIFKSVSVTHLNDKLELDFNGTTHLVYVDAIECNKYNTDSGAAYQKPIILQYLNKYGAKTRIPFALKYTETINTSSDSFKRNLIDYSALTSGNQLHTNRKRITASKQAFTINTDWIAEHYVNEIEELTLSEYAWALIPTVSTTVYQPINISTSNIVRKNNLNDKLIQYSFQIETATDYINTIR